MAGAAPFRRKMRRRRTKNCGKQGNITAPFIPTPQRKQDFAKFTFHEVFLFFLKKGDEPFLRSAVFLWI